MPLTKKERIIGGLLGVHAGDSLGATVEFESWESIRASYPRGVRQIVGGGPFRWPAGHATDDTDMTRAVLLAYRDRVESMAEGARGFDVPRRAGRHMLAWLEGDWPGRQRGSAPVDIGGATLAGLMKLRVSGNVRKAGAGRGRRGNGSLMRCIPTGLFERDTERIIEDSVLISGITHDDPLCAYSCAAYNIIARELVTGQGPADAVAVGLRVAESLEAGAGGQEDRVQDFIRLGTRISVAEMAESGPAPFPAKASGYVLDSLAIAVAAVLDPRPMEEVLVDVVRIGKDTDTNAAVAGGLLGVRDGPAGLNRQWREVLQFGDEFEAIATQVFENASAATKSREQ